MRGLRGYKSLVETKNHPLYTIHLGEYCLEKAFKVLFLDISTSLTELFSSFEEKTLPTQSRAIWIAENTVAVKAPIAAETKGY